MVRNFERGPIQKRSPRRVPVYKVGEKFGILASYLGRGNNPNALADIGLAGRTIGEAVSENGCTPEFHGQLQKRLAERGVNFSPDWVEWRDPNAKDDAPPDQRTDTPEHFHDRLVRENPTKAAEPKSPRVSAGDRPLPPDQPTTLTFAQFISRLELERVEKIMVFATTGTVTVRQLRQALKDARPSTPQRPVEVQVLLSAAYMSDAGRAAGTDLTRRDLLEFQIAHPHLRIEMRTYASAAVFRGAIVQYTDGSYGGHVGFYYWGSTAELGDRSHADTHNVMVRPSKPADPLLAVYISWFHHYWGTHIINTVVFDFDDTLFATTDAQVEGWIAAVEHASSEGIASVRTDRLLQLEGNRIDAQEMTRIFLEEQSEDAILRRIFQDTLADKTRDAIRARRFAIRERLTEERAVPIQDVLNDVRTLSREYRLVIVSATSEEMIKRVLGRHRISMFSYVFGRNARRIDLEWREVATKAQLFIRLSTMLGIPLDRIVFVGDSDADYRAATQLGVAFIENTFNAEKHGRETLIKPPSGARPKINGRRPGELIAAIEGIERELRGRWTRI